MPAVSAAAPGSRKRPKEISLPTRQSGSLASTPTATAIIKHLPDRIESYQRNNLITHSLEFTPEPRLLFIPTPCGAAAPSLPEFSIFNCQLSILNCGAAAPHGQRCAPKVCSHRRPCQFRDTSLPCLPSMTRNLQSSEGIILSDFPEEGIFLALGSPLQNTRNSVAKSLRTHRKLATNRRSPHGNLGSAAETCDKPLASIAFLAEASCNRSLFT